MREHLNLSGCRNVNFSFGCPCGTTIVIQVNKLCNATPLYEAKNMPDGNGAVFAFARMPIWKALAADYLSMLAGKSN